MMIKLDNVSKIFDTDKNIKVIDDVSISIEKGEFVVLIGPSGCGKTTLLNMMAGYEAPSSGSIKMNEEKITGPSHTRAVLSQENTLYPWLNVSSNIAYGLKARGISKDIINKRTSSILKEVGLSDYAKHKTFEISGGMKQRVSLAQTLVNDPSVILLDEPFGALDSLTRNKMQRLLHNLWIEKSLTIFMITHDIDEALLLASKIYVMSNDADKTIKTFKPEFYKSENYERVNLETSFIDFKKEIIALI